jgi:potassium/hydrogen antiporter
VYVVLLALGVVYFLSHALSLSFQRTNIPDVLLLTLLGIAVGPLLGWVRPEQFGDVGGVLTTIALTVILFESGTTVDARAVVRAAGGTATVTVATIAVTILGMAGVFWFAGGLTVYEAIITGAILSGTSAAVVIPMVKSLKVESESSTLMILESAITDVTCIVIVFALLDGATRGEVSVGPLIGKVLASLLFATVIGFVGGVAWLRIWNVVREFDTTIFTTIAAAFVLYGSAEFLGFSGAIAALAFGITLANHEFFRIDRYVKAATDAGITVDERRFYGEIVFLLKTFFFLYLGVSMRFDEPLVFAWAALGLVALYGARMFLVRALVPGATPRRDAAIIGVMIPKGLAAAVLAGLPVAAGLPGGEHIQNIVYAVVLLSIAMTAVFVIGLERGTLAPLARRILRRFPETGGAPPVSEAE